MMAREENKGTHRGGNAEGKVETLDNIFELQDPDELEVRPSFPLGSGSQYCLHVLKCL